MCSATLVVLFLTVPAIAPAKPAPKPITGRLSAPGYTVIALAKNGRATSRRTRPGRLFRLRPPAERVTLHLRASDGTYAGPVVVSAQKKGKRAVLGVRAGAKLHTVRVRPAKGYASVKSLGRHWRDGARWARARKGVPIGAGKYGFVRSKPKRGAVPGDLDLDGIANSLDVDDDGDRILDNLDRSKKGKGSASAQASGDFPGPASGDFGLKTILFGSLFETVNANAGMTDAQIGPALPRNGVLLVDILPGDSAELDCGQPQSNTNPGLGGLVYCTTGGTGSIMGSFGQEASWPLFPNCCDTDGDGFGTLVPEANGNPLMWLHPGATSDQIGSGDVLIQRVTTNGQERQFVATLQYVFVTHPALVSYSDGQGNSATLSYPVAFGARGNRELPFPVEAGPSGDVVVTLTFWRPQRRPIPPETDSWIDIGGLDHAASLFGEDTGVSTCERSAYSSSDPNLTPIADPEFQGAKGRASGFTDLSPDRPASPANTFTYQLNLTECLKSKGRTFDSGQTQGFTFSAYTPQVPGANPDNANTAVFFRK
jgi:hypothetical protein